MPKLTLRNVSPHFRILRPRRIRGNMCWGAKISLQASNMVRKVSGEVCMPDLYSQTFTQAYDIILEFCKLTIMIFFGFEFVNFLESTGHPKIKSALGYLKIVSTPDSQRHLRGPNRFWTGKDLEGLEPNLSLFYI